MDVRLQYSGSGAGKTWCLGAAYTATSTSLDGSGCSTSVKFFGTWWFFVRRGGPYVLCLAWPLGGEKDCSWRGLDGIWIGGWRGVGEGDAVGRNRDGWYDTFFVGSIGLRDPR